MTDKTRVSLDFRVIINELWEQNINQYSKDRGYYCQYVLHDNKWKRLEDENFSITPDSRFGFPFSAK